MADTVADNETDSSIADRPFDVKHYTATAQGSLAGDLHVDTYGPLDPALVEALAYLRRRESESAGWLSRVLVTATHKEARVTAFLSSWAYERHWIAQALAQMSGRQYSGAPALTRLRTIGDRGAPLIESVVGNVHGRAIIAVHMAERLIDTWLIDRMLQRVSTIGGDPALAEDIRVLRAVLGRQQDYLAESARHYLSEGPRSRRLARVRLAAVAWPLGADREPARAIADVIATLFAGDPGWAVALDARVDALPGLAGLNLMTRTAAKPGRPPLRRVQRPAAALGRGVAGLITLGKGTSAHR
ncbi:hypothetical protein [uncultured Amnibacterium sp.]|uniref:hypothetical protein n=1 Tax=uncultured Amnibacterium sp. TaxID=1631851 RepID=UPI0035CA95E2